LAEITQDMRYQVIDDLVTQFMPPKSYADQWNTEGLQTALFEGVGLEAPVVEWAAEEGVDDDIIREKLEDLGDKFMAKKAVDFGPENMRMIEKQVLLETIDGKWREHLVTLEHLRAVVGFRSYAQRDPLNEYKSESFQLFESLLDSLREQVTQVLGNVRMRSADEQQAMMLLQQAALKQQTQISEELVSFNENDRSTWGNPGRNESCPCGSGKKFKQCHGKI